LSGGDGNEKKRRIQPESWDLWSKHLGLREGGRQSLQLVPLSSFLRFRPSFSGKRKHIQ